MDVDEDDVPSGSRSLLRAGTSTPPRHSSEKRELESADEATPAPPEAKRKRFFVHEVDDNQPTQAAASTSATEDVRTSRPSSPRAVNGKGKGKARQQSVVEIGDDSEDEDYTSERRKASTSTSRPKSTPEPLEKKRRVPRDGSDFTGERYLGSFVAEGWATTSSKKDVFKESKRVTIERPAKSAVDQKKHAASSSAAKEKDNNAIVRFRNSQGSEIGRIEQKTAVWMARAMDLGLARFEGIVVDCPKVLSSGLTTISLKIRAYIKRSAFTSLDSVVKIDVKAESTGAKATLQQPVKPKSQRPGVIDETKDTEAEFILTERKGAVTRLFNALKLHPVYSDDILKKHKKKGKINSKRAVLEHFDGKKKDKAGKSTKDKKGKDVKGKGKDKDVENEEEGDEVTQQEVDSVFAEAARNDMNLPEMEPPSTFALQLRPYQKQALHWMSTREGTAESAREEVSLHPLWEEYAFPPEDAVIDLDAEDEPFFYNPYSGELSLEFPRASKKLRGGILADEMGLGKTIMVAALIHTNTPGDGKKSKKSRPTASSSSSDDDFEDQQDDSDAPYIPSPVGKQKKKHRQATLIPTNNKSIAGVDGSSAKRGATLVIAPTSLLNQWRDELLRSSNGAFSILVYNDTKEMTNLKDELDGGVDVVIASYGKIGAEYEKLAKKEDAKGSVKPPTEGLYSVEWFRIILDEAHNIKSRSTRAAKSCYALRAKRRWCLTGTPIVNRLEDLYSLLHFIRCEPYGNWAHFKAFITIPYQNGDPGALRVVQYILQDLLLRREKSMKDKDGNPIVPLPPKKTIQILLDLSKDERAIYDKVRRESTARFREFIENGTAKSNTIAILALITRLRQACLHPELLLKAGSNESEVIKKMVAKWMAKGGSDEAAARVLEEHNTGGEELQPICMYCNDVCEDAVFFPCEHSGCKACMITYLTEDNDGEAVCPACGNAPAYGIEDLQQAVKEHASAPKAPNGTNGQTIDLGEDSDSDDEPRPLARKKKPLFRARSRDRSSSSSASISKSSGSARLSPQLSDSGGNWLARSDVVPSTKIKALIEHLLEVKHEEPTFHAVVFSQFTSFLDLVEVSLSQAKLRFVRLDGTMDRKRREAAVKQFNNKSKPCIFLISMKAGGTGLNLTVANRIYILDWWWNSAIEAQAIDRVHRFGQEQSVTVYRYLVKASVEGRMLKLQERKSRVVNASLAKGTQQGTTLQDLQDLFAEDSDDGEPYYLK